MFDRRSSPVSKKTVQSTKRSDAIAVIGFSGRFPGGANSPDLLWDMLKSGEDAVTEVKGDRWDLGWHNPDQDRNNRIYAPSGGFLDQIDGFDAEFFGISPREAQQIDPQQRLLLELAWEAFEDAGIPPRSVAGQDVGVFVGISNHDYMGLGGTNWPDAYSNTGNAFSIAANRISYIFDLHGPSFAVDTACSSSLVCIHQACQALQNGECSSALAGGVNILADIGPWLGFSRASMLSPEGRCKSFDADGNGYVRAEGGGFVLLKPLEDAERDGDNIMCVIRGSGINSDGRTLGLSMPNGDAQADLLEQLYTDNGIAPEDVFYVEAHGTGTSVGDPIECGALGKILGSPRIDDSVCHVGSVKSNIGHLESASGIAGLTKVLLAMKHREVPANLHYNTPNPKIEFDAWKLSVVDQPLPFPEREAPVVIGINSFGFGGTNAHVILEEYRPENELVKTTSPDAPDLLVISASSEDALKALAKEYADLLRAPDADWAEIVSGAVHCRSPLRLRLAITATGALQAAERLEAWLADAPVAGTAKGSANSQTVEAAFVYSGNGPQWWGMGRELLAENPVFRAEIEAVDAIFEPLSGWSLIAEMAKPEADSRIDLTEVAQPMLFALQMGLTAVFSTSGIRPKAVFGHSVGEAAAACASGALSREQATRVIFHRSQEQSATAGAGKMAALGLDEEAAREAIAQIDGWLEVAAINGPDAVTVAGEEAALEALVDKVTGEGKFARLLQLNYPFHTKAMDGIRDGLLKSLADLEPVAAEIPFVSTVSGAEVPGDTLTAQYWFDNIRQPVQFHKAVEHLLTEQGVTLFIEIGPHPVLKDYVSQAARSAGMPTVAMQTLRRPSSKGPESDVENLATAVAAAYANGASNLAEMFARPVKSPNLPTYPWQRSRHWRGGAPLPDNYVPLSKDHPLLGARLPRTDGLWEMPMDKNLLPYLKDHVIQGAVLFPAAGYLELTIAAAREIFGKDRIIDVETFQILRPLVLGEDNDPLVQTLVDSRDGTVEISSRRERTSKEHTVHVRNRISEVEDAQAPVIDLDAIRSRVTVEIGRDEHFDACNYRGLNYGPTFQGIQKVRLSPEDAQTREALGEISVDFLKAEGVDPYRSHPSIFDSCLQAMITLTAQLDKRNVSTIPIQFERIRSYAPLEADVFVHVKLLSESDRSVVSDFDIVSRDGRVLLSVERGRCQKANLTGAVQSPLTSEWWRADSAFANTGSLPTLPAVASVSANANACVQSETLRDTFDTLAAQYAIKALDVLRPDADRFDLSSFARHARIRRDATPLLMQLLEIAEAAGQVTRDGKHWVWASKGMVDPDRAWAEAFWNNPAHQAELLLLSDAGETLAAQLKGAEAAAANSVLLDQIKDTAPFAKDRNGLLVDLVEKLVADWPDDRPMRILEVGGGSGGLTSWILPLLPAERVDYLFTDASEAHVARAERRFEQHRFVRTQAMSLSIDAKEQGLPHGYFDLVIVNSLAGASKLVAQVLDHVRNVMSDGALVVAMSPQSGAMAKLILGAQAEVDPGVVETGGFSDVQVFERAGNKLVLGRNGTVPPVWIEREAVEANYLILAEDPGVFAEGIAAALSAQGKAASVIGFPETTGEAGVKELTAALQQAKPDHVVLLGARNSDGDAASLFDTQSRRSLTATALVVAMEDVRQTFECKLTIVTRGAFNNGNGQAPIDPAEAALWGMGRVIGNEHGGLDVRLVDVHADAETADVEGWLADELLRRDDETEVQIAGGHRYVNRQRTNTLTDEARHAGQTAEAFALDFVPQGGIDSLYLRALERKAPQADEVEIAVKAGGLNFRDVMWCMGMLPEEAVEHGFSGPTIGMECSGEVVRVGANVTHVAPGDRVLAFASSCFGSHVTTEAKSVEKMPEGMEFSAAATIPTTFLTAWYGLDYLARLEEDETILIHGAAGGVGLAAIQIAKLKGAKIIGTAGSPQKRRMLELLACAPLAGSWRLANVIFMPTAASDCARSATTCPISGLTRTLC